MTKKPTLGQILVMAGGVLTFIFGFLDWLKSPIGGSGINAWSSDSLPGLFPWATTSVVLCLAVAALVAAKVFAGNLPEKLWIFTLNQLVIIVGAGGLWLVLSLLISNKHGADTGIGLILSIFGTAAVLAGGILDELGIDPLNKPVAAGGPGGQPWGQPGGQPPQPGWGQPQAPQQPPAPGWGQPQAPSAAPPPPAPQAPPGPPPAPPAPPTGDQPPPPPGQAF
ncbi:MAG TPA: hypothetical protein VHA73_02005 [Acidimicrobiales bacterium]|jgi:hypothetical protein|nr:hypothetical protein [Acidimicrobiales bacterium]